VIAFLKGRIIDHFDHGIVLDVSGVGYEVFCSQLTLDSIQGNQNVIQLFVYTQYRSEGVSLFGFLSPQEKELFLNLIKVDTVGPKSALNIISGAPWQDLVHMIEAEDITQLSKLPKISKKTAELVVVKLKSKLKDLSLATQQTPSAKPQYKPTKDRKLKDEVSSALVHLGYRTPDIERVLDQVEEDFWTDGMEAVVRRALSGLSGQI
jgi:Holliday junction DNA helicase RuvA